MAKLAICVKDYKYCDMPGSPCLSEKRVKCTVRFFFLNFLSVVIPDPLPGAQDGFVGDPTSLARDNIYIDISKAFPKIVQFLSDANQSNTVSLLYELEQVAVVHYFWGSFGI